MVVTRGGEVEWRERLLEILFIHSKSIYSVSISQAFFCLLRIQRRGKSHDVEWIIFLNVEISKKEDRKYMRREETSEAKPRLWLGKARLVSLVIHQSVSRGTYAILLTAR